jgi:kynureninase
MGSQQHPRDLKIGPPLLYTDDIEASKLEYAQALDVQDPLRNFRDEFIIPSVKDLQRKKLAVAQGMYNLIYLEISLDRCH